ncbi:hypothetical protein GCM10009682_58220 [Luedemannella flava]|uniref:Methyltransferase type 11 domain-containing protein n=1 Tax=Luedemannella flava TaxID=349316 RepID=A0ABP4Z2F5_9ACTN
MSSEDRWAAVLAQLDSFLTRADAAHVLVEGADGDRCALVADRLAGALRAGDVEIVRGPQWRDHRPAGRRALVIWLRTGGAPGDGEHGADVVIDLRDAAWPVIRRVREGLADHDGWHASESRAFFAVRAATWDTQFGDDLPAYAAGVAAAELPVGGAVLDAGCGTGRALPALREAVGGRGVVFGADVTPEMLEVAADRATRAGATLVRADALRLPFGAASVDAVFAAGLINHLPDPVAGLAELARVTRPGGRLVLFHPSGRAALAARHGRELRPDDLFAEGPLRTATTRAGWRLDTYDDAPHRFLTLATRT